MAAWFVYLLRCANDALYCGIAKDPDQRFKAHATGKGARYTRMHGAVALVYREGPYNHGDALRRERRIKALPRSHKLQLILGASAIEASPDLESGSSLTSGVFPDL